MSNKGHGSVDCVNKMLIFDWLVLVFLNSRLLGAVDVFEMLPNILISMFLNANIIYTH